MWDSHWFCCLFLPVCVVQGLRGSSLVSHNKHTMGGEQSTAQSTVFFINQYNLLLEQCFFPSSFPSPSSLCSPTAYSALWVTSRLSAPTDLRIIWIFFKKDSSGLTYWCEGLVMGFHAARSRVYLQPTGIWIGESLLGGPLKSVRENLRKRVK